MYISKGNETFLDITAILYPNLMLLVKSHNSCNLYTEVKATFLYYKNSTKRSITLSYSATLTLRNINFLRWCKTSKTKIDDKDTEVSG